MDPSECQKHPHQYTENAERAGPNNRIKCKFHSFILLSRFATDLKIYFGLQLHYTGTIYCGQQTNAYNMETIWCQLMTNWLHLCPFVKNTDHADRIQIDFIGVICYTSKNIMSIWRECLGGCFHG